MLFLVLLLAVVAFLLLNAGIKGGDTWKQPWAPLVTAFSPPSGK